MFNFGSKPTTELDEILTQQRRQLLQKAFSDLQEVCRKYKLKPEDVNFITDKHEKILLTSGKKSVEYISIGCTMRIKE